MPAVELIPYIGSVVIMPITLELSDVTSAIGSGHGNEIIVKRRIKGMVLSVKNEECAIPLGLENFD